MPPGRVGSRRGLPEISYHLLILVAGFAVAMLAFVIALAVGPYGRRGVRFTFGSIALIAFVGSVAWLVVYLGMIEQRRAIEERIAALRTQATASGTLACLERATEALQASCAQSLFASPGAISSAGIYTASRLDAMKAARRYSGPRTPQFDDAVATLERALQEDPFGLAADILVRREGCTAQRCEALSLFSDSGAACGQHPQQDLRRERGALHRGVGSAATGRTADRRAGARDNAERRNPRTDPRQVRAALGGIDPAGEHHDRRTAAARGAGPRREGSPRRAAAGGRSARCGDGGPARAGRDATGSAKEIGPAPAETAKRAALDYAAAVDQIAQRWLAKPAIEEDPRARHPMFGSAIRSGIRIRGRPKTTP